MSALQLRPFEELKEMPGRLAAHESSNRESMLDSSPFPLPRISIPSQNIILVNGISGILGSVRLPLFLTPGKRESSGFTLQYVRRSRFLLYATERNEGRPAVGSPLKRSAAKNAAERCSKVGLRLHYGSLLKGDQGLG
jgi:hypothetical protein